MKTNAKSMTIDELLDFNVKALQDVRSGKLVIKKRNYYADDSVEIEDYCDQEIAKELITYIVEEVSGSVPEGIGIL
jgi:xanthine dehydrogenase molybdopterin-binding subunit B